MRLTSESELDSSSDSAGFFFFLAAAVGLAESLVAAAASVLLFTFLSLSYLPRNYSSSTSSSEDRAGVETPCNSSKNWTMWGIYR